MDTKKIFAILFVLIIASSSSVAVKNTEVPDRKPFFNSLINSIQDLPATMVGGKLCSTYPDEQHPVLDDSFEDFTCPDSLSGGCAVDWWKESSEGTGWDYLEETQHEPGEEFTAYNGQRVDIYYCHTDVECTDYESQGCGEGSCSSDEMYRTRSCDSDEVDEEVCVGGWEECTQDAQDESPCDYYGEGDHCSSEDNVLSCEDTDGDGGLEASWEECDGGCSSGECVDQCSDESPCDVYGSGSKCSDSGDGIITCSDTDGDGCLESSTDRCGGDEKCVDGSCVDDAESDISVSDIEVVTEEWEPGDIIEVKSNVTNSGRADGETRVGCGVYSDDLEGKVFSTIGSANKPVSNCCSGDDFSSETDYFDVSGKSGEVVEFSLRVPEEGDELSCGDYRGTPNYGDSYTVVCGTFDKCFEGYDSKVEEDLGAKPMTNYLLIGAVVLVIGSSIGYYLLRRG